ncbi:MAG: YibE/F family protein [Actinomycetota bacterium]
MDNGDHASRPPGSEPGAAQHRGDEERIIDLTHSHGHGHGHGLEGSWDRWLGVPALRVILGAVAIVGLATVVGLIALWPDGSGRETAIEEAAQLGLATEQFEATVNSVVEARCSYSSADDPQDCRTYDFVVHEGPDAGTLIALPEYNLTIGAPAPTLSVGDAVFIGYEPITAYYFYADRDRGNTLVWLSIVFAVVVIALARWRGFSALVAMAATLVMLIGFVAPSVLDGNDPVLVAAVAGAAIAFISLYMTHGFNPTTTVALAGTLASLLLTLVVAALFFDLAGFSGLATEEGLTLPLLADINVSSLLLAGAVIGALGALDDITVTQVAAVAELHHRNDRLTVSELVTSGVRVGREHIASVVNTLLLAYAGASMPLLLVFAASDQPLGTVANSEIVAVEIVRTLCGSIGLVAAVPVTTLMAALLVGTADIGPGVDDDGDDDGGGGDDGGGDAQHDGHQASAEPPLPQETRPTPEPATPTPAAAAPRRPAASWDDFAPPDDVSF